MNIRQGLSSNTPDEIRQLIKVTRNSLSNNLELLETELKERTANAVGEVKDTLNKVKSAFDVKEQIRKHPWSIFLSSVAFGVVAARLASGSERPSAFDRLAALNEKPLANTVQFPSASRKAGPQGRIGLADRFEDEIKALKGIAIGAVFQTLRNLAKEAVPSSISPKVDAVINRANKKFGGETTMEDVQGSDEAEFTRVRH